jgi:hypothetical protein
MGNWSKKFLEWTDDDAMHAFLSVVFTWDLPQVYQRAVWLKQLGYEVFAGGPAVDLMPDYLSSVAIRGEWYKDVLSKHNSLATFTSRGCIRRCPFCAVWRTEGELRELDNWPVRPIVCDNNLLACSRKHFDSVVDKLKPLSNIDFNQGLDARLLHRYESDRLAELDCMVRLAFDSTAYEKQFLTAYHWLRGAGFPKSRIRVYVLVGFDDTPAGALYRLELVRSLGILMNPMRYNPLDTLVRDSYVGANWTDSELARYVRYWANLRYFGAVPFEDFR